MNKRFSIRLYESNDLETLNAIDRECFPSDDPYEFVARNSINWLGYSGNSLCAFCALKILENQIGFLSRAGVLKNYRGKNIQSKLIQKRIKKAKELKLKKLITYTSKSNVASANNLIKNKFQLYIPSYAWAGKEQLYFYLDL